MPRLSFSEDDDDSKATPTIASDNETGSRSSSKLFELSQSRGPGVDYSRSCPNVARIEQQVISKLRISIAVVTLLVATGVLTAAILLTNSEEEESFESHFDRQTRELQLVMQDNTDTILSSIQGFSLGITSNVQSTNTTFPFASIPHYVQKSKWFLGAAAGAERVTYAPWVENIDRSTYEEWVLPHLMSWWKEEIEGGFDSMSMDGLREYYNPEIHAPSQQSLSNHTSGSTRALPLLYEHPIESPGNWNNDLLQLDIVELQSALLVAEETMMSVINCAGLDCHIIQPVFESIDAIDTAVAGVLWVQVNWKLYLENLLSGSSELLIVLRSTCSDQTYTYLIKASRVEFLGTGDRHDSSYNDMEVIFPFAEVSTEVLHGDLCMPQHWIHIYPTRQTEESFESNDTAVFTVVIVLVFVFTSLLLGLYDFFVRRAQRKFKNRVAKQDRIMANVFPTAIRDRLYAARDSKLSETQDDDVSHSSMGLEPDEFENPDLFGSAPLAELFPSVTVVFADISGFTAWSSAREPPEVFMLLEAIYGAFDKIASRLGVFKVETVGDCYVAVAGLPDPREDHVLAAAKFSRAILRRMSEVTFKLEAVLGPDTTSLQLRVGMNSGQVTAGVLRGERARFQLFGDTINTACRMESTGKVGQIHISGETARMLKEKGKSSWIKPRSGGAVPVKGKGTMKTYWLLPRAQIKSSHRNELDDVNLDPSSVHEDRDPDDEYALDEDCEFAETSLRVSKTSRLVAWHVEILSALLQQIVATRGLEPRQFLSSHAKEEDQIQRQDKNVLTPVIELKRLGAEETERMKRAYFVDLGVAREQLQDALSTLAGMYRDNAFHNFEHASHTAASARKLLARIAQVENSVPHEENQPAAPGNSFGVTSDPLTQFTIILAAIFHDLDHPGVSNAQLVVENTRNAQIYQRSIAQQNAVDLIWEVLMSPEYSALRSCIYQSKEEMERFRQILVNSILATDIADEELQGEREARWEAAFSGNSSEENDDPKATLIIEYIMQAADAAPTMQHWSIYQRWSEQLFHERYNAYRAGRADTDPSVNWYQGEIDYFDSFVIPLAMKLECCGVFGLSSDEYLSYAEANRDEWIRKGQEIVSQYVMKFSGAQKLRLQGSALRRGSM